MGLVVMLVILYWANLNMWVNDIPLNGRTYATTGMFAWPRAVCADLDRTMARGWEWPKASLLDTIGIAFCATRGNYGIYDKVVI